METFCEFKEKEVINVCDGSRLGFVCDLEFEKSTGKIVAIIIPEDRKMLCLFTQPKVYYVPWKCIKRIGDDIILIEVDPDEIIVKNE